MTNIKKLLQILIPGIILAIIVYALFLFFGGNHTIFTWIEVQ